MKRLIVRLSIVVICFSICTFILSCGRSNTDEKNNRVVNPEVENQAFTEDSETISAKNEPLADTNNLLDASAENQEEAFKETQVAQDETNKTEETNKEDFNKKDNKSEDTYEWKQFLVDYENWMDNYIEFMKKYQKDPSNLTLLNDYVKLMDEYTVWMDKVANMQDDISNDQTALVEYLNTINRINEKMLKALE